MTIADSLCLAATPTFAAMALLTALSGGGPQDVFCAGMHGAAPLGGMTGMYLLMSAVHSASWLKLLCGRCRAGGRS
jgi:hypothetical protein